jgi:hypothetical protein
MLNANHNVNLIYFSLLPKFKTKEGLGMKLLLPFFRLTEGFGSPLARKNFFWPIFCLFFLAACQDRPTWYGERCTSLGFKPGSSDYQACVARYEKWVADDRRRARNSEGIGP